jgi:hypothetical protein
MRAFIDSSGESATSLREFASAQYHPTGEQLSQYRPAAIVIGQRRHNRVALSQAN